IFPGFRTRITQQALYDFHFIRLAFEPEIVREYPEAFFDSRVASAGPDDESAVLHRDACGPERPEPSFTEVARADYNHYACSFLRRNLLHGCPDFLMGETIHIDVEHVRFAECRTDISHERRRIVRFQYMACAAALKVRDADQSAHDPS